MRTSCNSGGNMSLVSDVFATPNDAPTAWPTQKTVPGTPGAFLTVLLGIAASCLMAPASVAQDFAIEPIGFTSVTGGSTDGNFAVSGTMKPADSSPMSGGVFSVTGEFVSLLVAVPTDDPLTGEVITIFDNIGGEENGVIGPSDTRWLAGKFCLGAQPYDLDSVSLLLDSRDSNGQPGPPSTVRLQIFSNDPASGKPSAGTGLIMNLSGLTNPITPPQWGRGLVKWTNATPFKLSAHACYWAVLSRESGGYIGQTVSVTMPTGPAGTFGRSQSDNAGATWEAPGNFNFKMLIQGIASGTPQALAITAASFSGTELRFSFLANSGQSYVIESRADLAAGVWAEVPGTTTTSSGVAQKLIVPIALAHPQQFFRVRIVP